MTAGFLFHIQCRYTYGWDDAGWTEEVNGAEEPLRFSSVVAARNALREFFRNISEAVAAGDIASGECVEDYRIVDACGNRVD